ncbi:MAG: Hsp20/alpha crystallin family protein [Bacteroidia bacterium]
MNSTIEKRPARRGNNFPSFWNNPIDRFFRNDFPIMWDEDLTPTVPSINITEEKDNFVVSMAAPGLKKEDFDISLDGNMLTISCEQESGSPKDSNGNGNGNGKEKENGSKNYSHREYNYSYFSRTVTLPDSADDGNIKAKYTDGILNLTIPKKPEAGKKNNQKIKVE